MNEKVIRTPQNDEELRQYLADRMQGERLNIEAIRNRLVSAVFAVTLGAKRLKPYPSYREWLEQWEPKYVNQFLQASDPAAISEYDRVVQTFNADMERIKAENDSAAIRDFVEKLLEISKGK